MPDFKVDFVCNAGKQGFVETWYVNKDTEPTCRAFAELFAVERAKLFGTGLLIEALRIRDTAADSPTFLYTTTTKGLPFAIGKASNANNLADQVNAAIFARASTTGGKKRQIWLRGCPDSWITRSTGNINTFDLSNVDLQTSWNAFVAFTKKNGGVLRLKNRVRGTVSTPIRKIDDAIEHPLTSYYQVTTIEDHGFLPGDFVTFRGVTGDNVGGLRGTKKVYSVPDLKSFVIPAYPKQFPPIRLEKKGTVYKLDYVYSEITLFQLVRVATRRTGRALFVPRGRRRVAR